MKYDLGLVLDAALSCKPGDFVSGCGISRQLALVVISSVIILKVPTEPNRLRDRKLPNLESPSNIQYALG